MTGPDRHYPGHEAPDSGASGGGRFFGRRRSLQTPAEALHPDAAPPPPSRPNSERRPILSALSGFFSLLLVGGLIAVASVSFANRQLAAPGPLTEDKVIYIAPRTDVTQILTMLQKENVIDQPTLVKSTLWVQRKWSRVRAGEYLFPARVSHSQVIDTLVAGRQVLHSITLPEGLTSLQIVERLRESDLLTGDIEEVPPEGSLLPETYRVARGASRAQLIRKMQQDQERLLERIWRQRAKDIPLKSPQELVTMASIIEKETGRADERTRVAGVFYNRLNRGMRLQSDPTIVYGLVGGKGSLGRPILRSEIRKPTAYNTYVIPALPPGPIANPGRAALEAAANPSRTNDLYFVANGTGGHTFAETLADHNRNVARWRQIERERAAAAEKRQQDGEAPAEADPTGVDRVTPDADEPEAEEKPRRRGAFVPAAPFGSLAAEPAAPSSAADGSGTAPAGNWRESLAQQLADRYGAAGNVTVAVREAAGAGAPPRVADRGFLVGPGIDLAGLQIIGVTPGVTGSPLDGPIGEQGDPAISDPVADAGAAAQGRRGPRAVAGVVDASEGTKLDPLRSRGWDLNAGHDVPPIQ